MRLYTFYLSVALLAFGVSFSFLTSCASAQEKIERKSKEKTADEHIIEENKFKELLVKTAANLEGKTYRLTETIEYLSDRDANVESVTTKILEIIPPDKWRKVEEAKSPTTNTRMERIWDGKNLYVKENDGEWKKYLGGDSGSGDFTSGRTTTTYKFVGREILNNKTADVYESESHRIANKMTQTSQYRVEYVTKTKYWISGDVLLLKMIKTSEIVGSKALSRETAIYEYDSTFKIEAPIKQLSYQKNIKNAKTWKNHHNLLAFTLIYCIEHQKILSSFLY